MKRNLAISGGVCLLATSLAVGCGSTGKKLASGGAGGGTAGGGTAGGGGGRGTALGGKGGNGSGGTAGSQAGGGSAGGSTGGAPTGGSSGSGGLGGASGVGGTAGSGGSAGSSGNAGSGGTAGAGGSGAGGAGGIIAGGGGASGAGGNGGAAGGAGGSDTCDLGVAQSLATQQTLDLFGQTVYYADGATLPAGRYRVTYLDGCMKYASSQDWTIHAYPNGASAAWWLVGETPSQHLVVPPGTSGYAVSNGAFATFGECVAANKLVPPVEFDFAGGKIGVWLLDSQYSDNLAGLDGRNPKWQLSRLGSCTDGGITSTDASGT